MTIYSVFINNRIQAVRLPSELRLPESVKRVQVRAVGNERIISPVNSTWDSFFLNGPQASEDFLPEFERVPALQTENWIEPPR